ncbi:MAG: hypothetical protein ACP5VE_02920 [Chthonomonadales bacterium]
MEVSKGVAAAVIALVIAVIAAVGYFMFLKPKGQPSEPVKKMYLQHGLDKPQNYGAPGMGGAPQPGGPGSGGPQ